VQHVFLKIVNFLKLGDFMAKIQGFELVALHKTKKTLLEQRVLANCGIHVVQHISSLYYVDFATYNTRKKQVT
jgi:hypothetical protein